jgi:hypothetical protein
MHRFMGRVRVAGVLFVITLSFVACAPPVPPGPDTSNENVTLSPATLMSSSATVGRTYSASLAADAGPTTDWRVPSGSLPPGLTLGGGRISGTPTEAGAYTFAVTAQAGNAVATRRYTLVVRPDDGGAYAARATQLIRMHRSKPWPTMTGCTDHVGDLFYATAALWLQEDVAAANAKLDRVDVAHLLSNYCRSAAAQNSLWLAMLVRPYFLYDASSSWYPGRLTTSAANNLVAQMWKFANQWSEVRDTTDLWEFSGSENLDIQRRSFFLLAAQAFKGRADYASRVYADGNSVTEHYDAWRSFWSRKLDDLVKKGMFAEVGNHKYHGYTLSTIINIYNFAEDPILRKKAEIVLDVNFADWAQNQLGYVWGTGKSRGDAVDNYDGFKDAMTSYATLLLGPGQPKQTNHNLYLATSGYSPPDVVRALAGNSAQRGAYEYVTRRPGAGSGALAMNRSVRHYSYVTPDYILAGAQLNPNWGYATVSSAQRWQGMTFPTAPDARVYPQVGTTAQNADAHDNFYSVQRRGVFVTRKNPKWASYATLVYFSSNLDAVHEEDGWVFVKEGNAYVAVRPQMGSYSWMSAGKNAAASIDQRFIHLTHGTSPVIFEAARASEFGGDFSRFKSEVKANPRSYAGGVLRYTGTDGTTVTLDDSGAAPTVDGVAVNFAPAKVFDSPYTTSAWDSGRVTVSFAGHTVTYDVSNPNNPTKVVG